jgi:hypothetical protein
MMEKRRRCLTKESNQCWDVLMKYWGSNVSRGGHGGSRGRRRGGLTSKGSRAGHQGV